MAYKGGVLSVSLNDEGSLFVACMDSGIRIFNVDPLVNKLTIDSKVIGSVSICKLLHRTNLIAIVGGGQRQMFAENTVLIWDDHLKKFILEFTFASRVLSLRTRRDRLFVVERNRIHCFTYPHNPVKLFTIETRDNPNGICEVTPMTTISELQLLVYPGHRVGSVQMLDMSANVVSSPLTNENLLDNMDIGDCNPSVSISPTSITAHTTELSCIALNHTGTLLATTSRKGTLVRIFRTVNLEMPSHSNYFPLSPVQVAEFRRGIDSVTVYCIVFSPDSEYVLVSSDKGTVHIFALKETRLNRRSALSAVPLVNISSASYALAKFTLAAECACVCTFGPDRRSVYAICVDGTFHKYNFNKDGSCERDNYDVFLNATEEIDYIPM